MQQNMFPAQGQLYLNPSTYTSGDGVPLGMVQIGHLVGFDKISKQYTSQPSGATPRNTAVVGLNAMYSVKLTDYSSGLLGFLMSGFNQNDSVFNFGSGTGYVLGDFVGAQETAKLIIRPVKDDGTVDQTKPFVYFPFAYCLSARPFIWDRVANHLDAMDIVVQGMAISPSGLPFYYGDPTIWPSI